MFVSIFRFEPNLPITGVSRVITLSEDFQGDDIQLDVLLPKATQIVLDSSTRSTVNLPLYTEDNTTVMVFPANNYFFPNMTQFNGKVLFWLTMWKISDMVEGGMVPGDFMTGEPGDDDNGLLSAGMFCMMFTTPDRQPLTVGKGCEFRTAAEEVKNIKNFPAPILYGLNLMNAIWERNRQLTFEDPVTMSGEINLWPGIRDINIDWPMDTCFAKVRAFEFSTFDFAQQLSGINVSVMMHIKDRDGWIFSSHIITGSSGGCLRVLCCKRRFCEDLKFVGKMIAVSSIRPLRGANPEREHDTGLSDSQIDDLEYKTNDLYVESVLEFIEDSEEGPVYENLLQCEESEGSHFRFYNMPLRFCYGYVSIFNTNEIVPNVMLKSNGVVIGMTDKKGFYNVSLPDGETRIVIRSVFPQVESD